MEKEQGLDESVTLEIHMGDAIAFLTHPEDQVERFKSLIRESVKKSLLTYRR